MKLLGILTILFSILQNEGNILIAERNEVQQKLFVAVDVFILEVDDLPLDKRLKTLQVGIMIYIYIF